MPDSEKQTESDQKKRKEPRLKRFHEADPKAFEVGEELGKKEEKPKK